MRLFTRESDIRIYGLAFVEKIDKFDKGLLSIEQAYPWFFTGERRAVHYTNIGYTNKFLEVFDTCPERIAEDIKTLYRSLFPNAPVLN